MATQRLGLKVFVSYSHKDENLRAELDTHLAPLVREGLLSIWHDRKICPGESWEEAISESVESADILVALVSPDFIASDYCYGVELQTAIRRHHTREAVLVPVVIRPVDWTHTPISGIQALPKNAIPITTWDNRDEAWLSVVEGIRSTSVELLARHEEPPSSLPSGAIPIQPLLGSVIERLEVLLASETQKVPGIPSGFRDLDALTNGFEPGEVIVVSSSPKIDRLGVVLKLATHAACKLRLPSLLICASHEEEYVASRLLASLGRISFQTMRTGRLTDAEWDKMTVALGILHEAPITILPYRDQDLSDLLDQIDQVAGQFGALPVVAIDSLEHLAQSKPGTLRALRKYAIRHQRLLYVGTGLERDPGHRRDKRPMLEDLGEWASVCEDIDSLLLIYNDQIYRPDTSDAGLAELIVEKSRSGTRGTIQIEYSFESLSYDNFQDSTSTKSRH